MVSSWQPSLIKCCFFGELQYIVEQKDQVRTPYLQTVIICLLVLITGRVILNRQAILDERCSYRVTTVILVFNLCLLGFSFLIRNAFSQWPMVANYYLSGPCLIQDFCVLLLSSEVPQLFDQWINYYLLC